MAKGMTLSDEYHWSASAGLFEWVVEYLLGRVRDPAVRTELREVVDHNLPGVDLSRLPEAGRREVLAALDGGLVEAARSSPDIVTPEPERGFVVGHVKVLTLMAGDVVRSASDGGQDLPL
jgi:hypothetical protein